MLALKQTSVKIVRVTALDACCGLPKFVVALCCVVGDAVMSDIVVVVVVVVAVVVVRVVDVAGSTIPPHPVGVVSSCRKSNCNGS